MFNLIDDISIDELGMREKLQREVERYQKFRTGVLGVAEDDVGKMEIGMKNYAKYILREGQLFEKREILSGLKSRLELKDKILHIT